MDDYEDEDMEETPDEGEDDGDEDTVCSALEDILRIMNKRMGRSEAAPAEKKPGMLMLIGKGKKDAPSE